MYLFPLSPVKVNVTKILRASRPTRDKDIPSTNNNCIRDEYIPSENTRYLKQNGFKDRGAERGSPFVRTVHLVPRGASDGSNVGRQLSHRKIWAVFNYDLGVNVVYGFYKRSLNLKYNEYNEKFFI